MSNESIESQSKMLYISKHHEEESNAHEPKTKNVRSKNRLEERDKRDMEK